METYKMIQDATERGDTVCIFCGEANTMEEKKDFYDKMLINEKEITVGPFNGLFCNSCTKGFLTEKSEALFNKQVAEANNVIYYFNYQLVWYVKRIHNIIY